MIERLQLERVATVTRAPRDDYRQAINVSTGTLKAGAFKWKNERESFTTNLCFTTDASV